LREKVASINQFITATLAQTVGTRQQRPGRPLTMSLSSCHLTINQPVARHVLRHQDILC
jgi:hypothetical protein